MSDSSLLLVGILSTRSWMARVAVPVHFDCCLIELEIYVKHVAPVCYEMRGGRLEVPSSLHWLGFGPYLFALDMDHSTNLNSACCLLSSSNKMVRIYI